MRNKLVTALTFLGLLASTAAFAAGSGGGGGGPCFEDSWSCTDYGICQANGTQSRKCTMTQDCAFAETPSPTEVQKCTPKCTQDTWTCGEWGPCLSSGAHSRSCSKTTECDLTVTPSPATSESCTPTPVPETQPAPEPVAAPVPVTAQVPIPTVFPGAPDKCGDSAWKCGDWSACDGYGNATRACSLTNGCTGVAEPSKSKRCEQLQCGGKPTLQERVSCRLGLAPSGIARELEIQYLPEECRSLPTANQAACVAKYKALIPCWEKEIGADRDICARGVLKVAEAATPAAKRTAAYDMIKFRFYDLSERAEHLIEDGVSVGDVAAFVATAELKKQEFNAATTKAQRRQIILDVRDAWKAFVAKAKPQLKK